MSVVRGDASDVECILNTRPKTELVLTTESSNSESSPDDDIDAKMVKPDCHTCASHPVVQDESQAVLVKEEPVKEKHWRKALPKKLLKTTSGALPRQTKPAIKKPLLPGHTTQSSRNLLGVLSGQSSGSRNQIHDGSPASAGYPNGRRTSKKSKELPVELRNKIVERHASGQGYRKIAVAMNIPSSTVGAIIRKWKVHHTTVTLPRSGCPTKLSNQARIRLIREATTRPSVTLKELKSSIAEMGENVCESTISRSLNQAGLYYKKLVPAITESSSSISSPYDDIADKMVKPDCHNICASRPVPQNKSQNVLAREEPVKTKHERKALPPEMSAKKLLKTSSEALSWQPKSAIKMPLLREPTTRSSKKLLGDLSGQSSSNSCQTHDGSPTSAGSSNGRPTCKKNKELSVELRNKIVERHTSGEGYRKISMAMNIPSSTVGAIIRKWKVHRTTVTLPRSGCPSKLSKQAKSRLVSEATARQTVTLEQVKSSIAEMGENFCESTISRSLQQAGLYCTVQLVPLTIESSSSVSSPDGDLGAKMVKLDCQTCVSHPGPQNKSQILAAREEPVKTICGKKALPPERRAKTLLKAPSKALPRQSKSAIITPLPERTTRSLRGLVGVPSGQSSSSSYQSNDGSLTSAGSPNGRKTTKKGKELPVELRDKIVGRHLLGEGYKKISKALNIHSSTVASIIRKWKVHRTTVTLPRSGCPSKLSNQAKNRLVREATVRPTVTLKELKSSIAEIGENVCESTISRVLNKAGLYYKELAPAMTESSSSPSLPYDGIGAKMVKSDCNDSCASHLAARNKLQTVVAREEPVKTKRGRKTLPPQLRAKKLVKTPSKALPRRPKPAIKKPLLPEHTTGSSRIFLGLQSGQSSSACQSHDGSPTPAGSANRQPTSKKTKELPVELRNKIVERHASGEGYKKISKSMNIPSSTVGSIIRKWKVHHTTLTLPRSGCPTKLSNQARIRLIREATGRPSVTLKELKSSIAEIGENVCESTISRALNKAGLYYKELAPAMTESSSSPSLPYDGIGAKMVKSDCNDSCASHLSPRNKLLTVVAREEPVKTKCGRKTLPPQLRAKKLVKTPSKALPRRPKPAIKKPLLPEHTTGSSSIFLGLQSGQSSSACQSHDGSLTPAGSANRQPTSKKTKELPVELRNKIVERHASGEGYKKISKSMNIPSSTVGSIIRKWKVHHTTVTLPRSGCPFKLSNEAKSRLIREATARPSVTLKELKSSIAEMGENVCESTISWSLHQAGLYYNLSKKTWQKKRELQSQQAVSSSQHHPYSEVLWWEHYVQDLILSHRNKEDSLE